MWIASKQLLAHQHPHVFIKVATSALKLALKYELSEFQYHISRMILSYYSVHSYSKSKFSYYRNIVVQSRRVMFAEGEAEQAFFHLYLMLSDGLRSRTEEEIQVVREPFDQKLAEFQDVQSNRYIRMAYLYKVFCAEIVCNHEAAILLCEEAILVLKSKPFIVHGALLSLEVRLIANLIKVGQLEQARRILESHINSKLARGHSWYTIHLYWFILECHSKKYNSASKILSTGIQQKHFSILSEPLRQLWLICAAFHAFLIETGRVDTPESKRKPFRIYKFLNDVPMYSKDKRGMNITILIIHVLFLMWQKKYSKAEDRIESLKAYSNRYLRDDANFRSNCFIKMLVQLPKADFHPIRVQRYAEKYAKRLKEVPLSKSRQGLEIEIIPYEHLWEMIIGMCRATP